MYRPGRPTRPRPPHHSFLFLSMSKSIHWVSSSMYPLLISAAVSWGLRCGWSWRKGRMRVSGLSGFQSVF